MATNFIKPEKRNYFQFSERLPGLQKIDALLDRKVMRKVASISHTKARKLGIMNRVKRPVLENNKYSEGVEIKIFMVRLEYCY